MKVLAGAGYQKKKKKIVTQTQGRWDNSYKDIVL